MPTTEEFNRRLRSDVLRMENELWKTEQTVRRRDYAIIFLICWIAGNLLASAYLIYTMW